jgi:hypothetical protein
LSFHQLSGSASATSRLDRWSMNGRRTMHGGTLSPHPVLFSGAAVPLCRVVSSGVGQCGEICTLSRARGTPVPANAIRCSRLRAAPYRQLLTVNPDGAVPLIVRPPQCRYAAPCAGMINARACSDAPRRSGWRRFHL